MVQHRKANEYYYALCRTAPLSMTLSELWVPQTTTFYAYCVSFPTL